MKKHELIEILEENHFTRDFGKSHTSYYRDNIECAIGYNGKADLTVRFRIIEDRRVLYSTGERPYSDLTRDQVAKIIQIATEFFTTFLTWDSDEEVD